MVSLYKADKTGMVEHLPLFPSPRIQYPDYERARGVAEAPASLVGGTALGTEGIRRRGIILQLRRGHHAKVRIDFEFH